MQSWCQHQLTLYGKRHPPLVRTCTVDPTQAGQQATDVVSLNCDERIA
jgi:hypothetical protein